MRYTLFGQVVENVHFFTRSGGYDVGSIRDLAVECDTQWNGILKPQLPPAVELIDITATDQSIPGGVQFVRVVNTNGTSGNPAFPAPNATYAIKFATGLSGRSNRGRMYFPCLQNTGVASGLLISTYAAQLVAAVAAFFQGIFVATGDIHVVVSYQTDCEWRTGGNPVPVTAYTAVDLAVDSQRRRLPGRGI